MLTSTAVDLVITATRTQCFPVILRAFEIWIISPAIKLSTTIFLLVALFELFFKNSVFFLAIQEIIGAGFLIILSSVGYDINQAFHFFSSLGLITEETGTIVLPDAANASLLLSAKIRTLLDGKSIPQRRGINLCSLSVAYISNLVAWCNLFNHTVFIRAPSIVISLADYPALLLLFIRNSIGDLCTSNHDECHHKTFKSTLYIRIHGDKAVSGARSDLSDRYGLVREVPIPGDLTSQYSDFSDESEEGLQDLYPYTSVC